MQARTSPHQTHRRRNSAHCHLHDDAQLIAIHDDPDLPLGKINLQYRGGDAGHRGLRSIMEWLDSSHACHTMIAQAIESLGTLLASSDRTDSLYDTITQGLGHPGDPPKTC